MKYDKYLEGEDPDDPYAHNLRRDEFDNVAFNHNLRFKGKISPDLRATDDNDNKNLS